MNKRLEEFKNKIKGMEIDVLGIGISNLPIIKYLAKNGAKVTAFDKRTKDALGEAFDELLKIGVEFSLGENYLDNIKGEMVLKTPGMRFDTPQLLEAKKRGAIITSEMELFFDFCPAKIIAVTGSDGKTTTTTIINKLLEKEGYKTWLGGNIGNPLFCSLEEISPDDLVVLELSSFQLHTMKKSPNVSVITNITPNHLDMHKSYQEYIDAKKNIMLYQNPEDLLIVNMENDVTREIGNEARGKKIGFSNNGNSEVSRDDEHIYYMGEEILKISDIKIPGSHNVENYMAAIGAVGEMVSKDTIKSIAKDFGGVEHRIELVRVLNGVKFYNSSIDSSPNRTINTLKVFPEKVIMIAGGKDKGIPYDEIGPSLVEKVKTLILAGATAGKIIDALKKTPGNEAVEVIELTDYQDAVKTAFGRAKDGDVVLLSPASTSFDRFKNFEERGKLFKSIVESL